MQRGMKHCTGSPTPAGDAMGGKKQPGRFTLQFNVEDPQQKTVSELLEQQGRHKAQFITSAVLQYMQPVMPKASIVDPPTLDKDTLLRMLLSILEKDPQLTATAPGRPARAGKPSSQTSSSTKEWDGSMGDDAMMAISETLAAFQQG